MAKPISMSGPGKLYMGGEFVGDIAAEKLTVGDMITEWAEHAVPFTDPGFEAALDLEPEAWATRMVYADLLDENGNAEYAAAQRWMAANEKRPSKPLTFGDMKYWAWWHYGRIDPMSIIPKPIYLKLPKLSRSNTVYPDRTAAELDLAHALRKAGVT